MNGVEEYNNKWKEKTMNVIRKSEYSEILYSFWMHILGSKEYSTASMYVNYVNAFLNYVQLRNLRQLKLFHYDSYLVSLKDRAASYQIVVYSALKKFSAFLSVSGISEDVMKHKDRPKFRETQKTIDKRERGYLTKDEIGIVNSKIYNGDYVNYKKGETWIFRDAAIILTFLNSGIRRAALYKLDIDDVDMDNCTISVLEKGGKYRKIALSQNTIDVLREWLAFRKYIVDDKEKALFVSQQKKRMSVGAIGHVVSNVTKEIDWKHITPHKLRATYGTQLYNMTNDLYFVQSCMGHSNPKTTEVYIRGQKDTASQKASELMSDFLS